MTIVSNYSDLSPAMRAALAADLDDHGLVSFQGVSSGSTGKALERRGLITWVTHLSRYQLTDAGQRARNHIIADVPAKVATILDKARELGLEVERSATNGTLKSWTISSPNPVDGTQVWLYWMPGPRGGRLTAKTYYGPSVPITSVALRHIRIPLQNMAESLQRHLAREAAKAQCPACLARSKPEKLAEAQAALAQVFAELDGAKIPSDEEFMPESTVVTVTDDDSTVVTVVADEMVGNLLHEELNLSTVHASDDTGQALCRPDDVLTSEMTLVDYPVDCQVCLTMLKTHDEQITAQLESSCPTCWPRACGEPPYRPGCRRKVRVLECGCPVRIVTDEGHQEGCVHREIDPTQPGWFMVGQYIYDHQAGVNYRVAGLGFNGTSKVNAVAVTINGGYGAKWVWYGEHEESRGGLELLEGPHIGLTDQLRRPWPKQPRAAINKVRALLFGQQLSGWAVSGEDRAGRYVIVNVPARVEPTRHRILIERYMPYPCTVQIRASQAGQVGDAIIIRPKED